MDPTRERQELRALAERDAALATGQGATVEHCGACNAFFMSDPMSGSDPDMGSCHAEPPQLVVEGRDYWGLWPPVHRLKWCRQFRRRGG